MPDPDKLDDGVSPLLDAIDELHSRGVGQHVWLPQLVVCGFQPYATHSVLEDLLGVRFPMRVDPHALFVTKIVLRRNPISHLKVTIEPGPGEKAENDPQQPKAFLPNVEDSVAAQLSSCLEQATKFMEVAARGGHNHKIVRIEFYGPDKPNVTVINLPQIPFPDSSDNQGQQNESFHRIGVAYIQNPRNIIVVAISADDAMDLERTYKLAGKYGQRPKKLFGVVTGIDTVEAGSEKAKSWAKILKEGIPFSLLGLHYLCDASCTLLNVPGCEEDKEHKKDIRFFGQREENLFTKPQIGIEGLLHRLEVLLTSHVSNTMYDLASDIERKINTQRSNIAKLNTPRGTPQQQKAYMFHLSSAFERITEQALNGMYRSDFFVTSVINSEPNAHNTPRLRAIIHGLNEDFADIMISAGCRRFIFGVNHQITSMLDPANPYEKIRTPEHLGRMEFEREVTGLIQQYRGIEFPGNTNQILLGYLFRDQSKPWEDIARFHLLNSWETTRSFVRHLLNYLAGDGVSAAIMHEIVGPRLDDMKCNLLAKVEELTTYHKRGHPMPLHRSYFRGQTLALDHSHPVNTPKCQSNRLLTKLEETLRSCPATALTSRFTMEELKTAAQRLESSSNLLTVSDFVDQFQSYYNHALFVFIDNVSTLAIENCLLAPLSSIMTTRTISDMADDKIAKLFAGAANTQDRLNCELEKLQSASQTLRKFKNLKSPVSPSLTAPQPAPTSQSEFKPWIRSIPVPQALLFDGKTPNPFGMLYKDSPSGSSGSSSGLHLPLSNNPGTTIRSLASYPNALLDSKSERSSVIVAADQAANQSARNAQSSVFSQADSLFDFKPDKSSTIVAADQVANQLARIALSNSGDRESSTSTATTPWTPNVSTQGTSLPSFAEASVTHITHDTGLDRTLIYRTERDLVSKVINQYQSITCCAQSVSSFSFEELRWAYYELREQGFDIAQQTAVENH